MRNAINMPREDKKLSVQVGCSLCIWQCLCMHRRLDKSWGTLTRPQGFGQKRNTRLRAAATSQKQQAEFESAEQSAGNAVSKDETRSMKDVLGVSVVGSSSICSGLVVNASRCGDITLGTKAYPACGACCDGRYVQYASTLFFYQVLTAFLCMLAIHICLCFPDVDGNHGSIQGRVRLHAHRHIRLCVCQLAETTSI